ncbi:6-hydroxymethylpterin diphosphokinase MptE-like protein [Natronomonas gomsonensis]|uniref:6-hydroxymethylpterin diphosphokinase MptE-like protein n=1 Tax=Natronomonas gomsonensis TaxID=1046043 RepID=UPI0015C0A964|nr:6-hydroxymethylpterin diphosphokinase MptE-like protein [Natronomonas gomsonensis]
MLYQEWNPAYEAILSDFGFDRAADEHARDLLAELLADERPLGLDYIDLSGTVAVCGAAPTLAGDLSVARRADSVVAASTAVDVLRDAGIAVDCMVTDLDKNPETARELTTAGTPVAAHAHGDNVEELRELVPTFDAAAVLPTTQAEPRGPVVNPGGFTDGDRAAFLADACGADSLVFAGWDFDDSTVEPTKARKLLWAERLLRWLELRRGERFGVLDGRRDGIDLPWLEGL